MMLQMNYLNTMSMTMSSSNIPLSRVASDSFVKKGTQEDLKGKNTKTHFCINVTMSEISCLYRQYFNEYLPFIFLHR